MLIQRPPTRAHVQSDASAATSKAESTAAAVVQVLAEREQLRENLEHAAITAERNGLLQGLVISESERRKKVDIDSISLLIEF